MSKPVNYIRLLKGLGDKASPEKMYTYGIENGLVDSDFEQFKSTLTASIRRGHLIETRDGEVMRPYAKAKTPHPVSRKEAKNLSDMIDVLIRRLNGQIDFTFEVDARESENNLQVVRQLMEFEKRLEALEKKLA